ncbi:uncharacterized protein LOC141620334 [Silene latifolia]|uniref:uncharacterized protein LOC141620334 n=1 Tax=Silene latifolia TaxID=37657 RepID=UPI003D76E575
MVIDGLGDTALDLLEEPPIGEEETPRPQLKSFFDMLEAAEMPLYKGSDMSVLQATSRLINIKCEDNLSHKCVDKVASLLEDALPRDNVMTHTFYNAKKLLKALQLPYQKIHCCEEGCPRLQRLYATRNIAEAMRWHDQNPRVQGTFAHPSDSEAWKHLDKMFPEFASEPRNVRLGLCTDGFKPYGQFGKNYSCWSVILTPYNLPPWLCMKKPFMFLSLIVPGPKNPKKNLDVYLQPLIEELKDLWEVGIPAFDVSKKKNFQLKAALLWTINNFPAYGMLFGWAIAGKLACPYCMEESKAFWLPHGGKMCWFDCHRHFLSTNHVFRYNKTSFLKNKFQKNDEPPPIVDGFEIWENIRDYQTIIDGKDAEFKELKKLKMGWFKRCIFWELPYWKHLLLRHNLDVMHIEKNFFELLIHTVMDNKKKTVDNHNSRKDLPKLGKRSHLHIKENGQKPKSPFALDEAQKKVLCEWICNLRFPDGYASDLSRCVDLNDLTLHRMKSHDCHVFMERLLPVALKHLLPKELWNPITKISLFFRDLCAPTLKLENIENLEPNIAEILCKLERVFPLSFFNSMEHLPINLPYEARVGGPVQYRWMYSFERLFEAFIREQHPQVTNDDEVWSSYEKLYPMWFKEHVFQENIKDDLLVALAIGPSKEVQTWQRYSINGFNFHTLKYGKNKASMNYGVCVNGIDGDDYYGTLEEIIELRYCGEQTVYNAIFFKCCWMDNSSIDTIVHDIYKLLEVNHKRKYGKYDPFVLAH